MSDRIQSVNNWYGRKNNDTRSVVVIIIKKPECAGKYLKYVEGRENLKLKLIMSIWMDTEQRESLLREITKHRLVSSEYVSNSRHRVAALNRNSKKLIH